MVSYFSLDMDVHIEQDSNLTWANVHANLGPEFDRQNFALPEAKRAENFQKVLKAMGLV